MAIAVKTTSTSSDAATRLQTTRIASEPITELTPVSLSSATEVFTANTSSRDRATVMGVALNSANVGEVVTILIYGYLSDPLISFPLNVPLFNSSTGAVSQQATTIVGEFFCEVGRSNGNNSVLVDPKLPVEVL